MMEDQEAEYQDSPDEDAGPAVEPIKGDQGAQPDQQMPVPAGGAAGFDPDAPVATSPPDPAAQSGVPAFPGQDPDAKPAPENAGPQDGSTGEHAEANTADGDGGGDSDDGGLLR